MDKHKFKSTFSLKFKSIISNPQDSFCIKTCVHLYAFKPWWHVIFYIMIKCAASLFFIFLIMADKCVNAIMVATVVAVLPMPLKHVCCNKKVLFIVVFVEESKMRGNEFVEMFKIVSINRDNIMETE